MPGCRQHNVLKESRGQQRQGIRIGVRWRQERKEREAMAHTDLQQPASPLSALAWGALVIGGIFAIIIGLVAIIWPSITFTVLVVLLGVYAFVSGLFTVLVGAVWPPGWGLRWLMVLEGVLGIVVGVLVFLGPETAALVLIYVVA